MNAELTDETEFVQTNELFQSWNDFQKFTCSKKQMKYVNDLDNDIDSDVPLDDDEEDESETDESEASDNDDTEIVDDINGDAYDYDEDDDDEDDDENDKEIDLDKKEDSFIAKEIKVIKGLSDRIVDRKNILIYLFFNPNNFYILLKKKLYNFS